MDRWSDGRTDIPIEIHGRIQKQVGVMFVRLGWCRDGKLLTKSGTEGQVVQEIDASVMTD